MKDRSWFKDWFNSPYYHQLYFKRDEDEAAHFIDQLINEYQIITGAKNDIDFPRIMIYSLPTPFYIDRPLDHALMQKTICEGLKKLESSEVLFIRN
jgi:hypothetical protein